jgi:hypothetical protein
VIETVGGVQTCAAPPGGNSCSNHQALVSDGAGNNVCGPLPGPSGNQQTSNGTSWVSTAPPTIPTVAAGAGISVAGCPSCVVTNTSMAPSHYSMAGDVTGFTDSNTITAIRTNAVAPVSPADWQSLTFVANTLAWTPEFTTVTRGCQGLVPGAGLAGAGTVYTVCSVNIVTPTAGFLMISGEVQISLSSATLVTADNVTVGLSNAGGGFFLDQMTGSVFTGALATGFTTIPIVLREAFAGGALGVYLLAASGTTGANEGARGNLTVTWQPN